MKDEFKDLRGRSWEMFTDEAYFGMVCVRVSSDRDFNSETSFHFVGHDEAKAFSELIKRSR